MRRSFSSIFSPHNRISTRFPAISLPTISAFPRQCITIPQILSSGMCRDPAPLFFNEFMKTAFFSVLSPTFQFHEAHRKFQGSPINALSGPPPPPSFIFAHLSHLPPPHSFRIPPFISAHRMISSGPVVGGGEGDFSSVRQRQQRGALDRGKGRGGGQTLTSVKPKLPGSAAERWVVPPSSAPRGRVAQAKVAGPGH